MGNVKIVYKQCRGANQPGAEIKDPKDFMSSGLDTDFGKLKEKYDSLPADKQAEIKAAFDGADVMKSSQNAG